MDVLSGGEKQRMAVSSTLLLNSLSVLGRYPSNLIDCAGWQVRHNIFTNSKEFLLAKLITGGILVKGKC